MTNNHPCLKNPNILFFGANFSCGIYAVTSRLRSRWGWM